MVGLRCDLVGAARRNQRLTRRLIGAIVSQSLTLTEERRLENRNFILLNMPIKSHQILFGSMEVTSNRIKVYGYLFISTNCTLTSPHRYCACFQVKLHFCQLLEMQRHENHKKSNLLVLRIDRFMKSSFIR